MKPLLYYKTRKNTTMSNATYAVTINEYKVRIKYKDNTHKTQTFWATDDGLNEWIEKRTNNTVEDVVIEIVTEGIKKGEPIDNTWVGRHFDFEAYLESFDK